MAASEVDLFANLGLSIASQMKSPHTRKEMQLSKGKLENVIVFSWYDNINVSYIISYYH